jgi:hypothetical protein
MSPPGFDGVAYLLLSGLGLVSLWYLGIEFRDWWKVRDDREAESIGSPKPAQQPVTSAPSRAQGVEAQRQEPMPQLSNASPERGRLQGLLNEGVRLEQDLPPYPSFVLQLQPTTRLEDVNAWEARVEAALRERPRDLALFYYEPQRSPLTAISPVLALTNPLKQRLQQRVRQLETIVQRMR